VWSFTPAPTYIFISFSSIISCVSFLLSFNCNAFFFLVLLLCLVSLNV
jgi:hypothetical protein